MTEPEDKFPLVPTLYQVENSISSSRHDHQLECIYNVQDKRNPGVIICQMKYILGMN